MMRRAPLQSSSAPGGAVIRVGRSRGGIGRRFAFALVTLLALIAPAFAQVPAPVPALPDAERRTSYSISGTTCACALNFMLLGDGSDYANWVEVFINGVRYDFNDASHGWTITSPSGSLATLARPITNAILTFNAAQTGTVQIVGARRPRRASQYNEGVGVPTRNFNRDLTDIIATQREIWDKTNDMTGRGLFGLPGESISTMPAAASRAGKFLYFDATGLIPQFTSGGAGTGNVVGPATSVVNDIACWNNTSGTLLKDCPVTGTLGNVVLSLSPTITTPIIDQINPSARSLAINSATSTSGATGSIAVRGSDNGVAAGTSIGGINNITTSWAVGNVSALIGGAYNNTMAVYAVGGLNFYSNATYGGTLTTAQQWVLGNSLTPIASGPVATFNKNASATPNTNGVSGIAPSADIVIHSIGKDGQNAIHLMQAFGTGVGNSTVQLHARGTQAAPTASSTNDLIAEWGAWPYATSVSAGYVATAGVGLQGVQQETCTTTSCGARLFFWATPTGSATSSFGMALGAGLAVGSGAADPAAGVVNVSTGYRVANAAASGNVLRGNGTNFVSAQLAYSDLTGTHNTNTNLAMGSGNICGTIPQATTSFFGTMGCQSTTEANWQSPVSAAFTAKNLRVVVTAAPAAGQTYAFTVRKNAVDTIVTCTISNPATTCSDLSNTASFAAGDLISMKVISSATAGAINAANTMITEVTTSP